MATFTVQGLSGATNGKSVLVAASSTPGTLIHTAVAGTTSWDEIVLDAANIGSTDVQITVQWGGTTANDKILVTIPASDGAYRVIPGWRLQNGLELRVYAATANVIQINGTVSRIA